MAATTVTIGSVTVCAPAGPTQVDLLTGWVSDLSADFTRYVYRTTANYKRQWTLNLVNLTTAQKNSLESYFRSTALGPTNTFTYTHSDGTSYSACRFMDTDLRFTRMNDAEWAVQVRIETANDINS